MKIFRNKPRNNLYEPQKQVKDIQNKKISITLSENLVDLNKENELVFYETNPVFGKEVKEKIV